MKANDSLECRNCHSSESMDLTKQNPRAASAHERFLSSGERTCIDCHKGRVHRLRHADAPHRAAGVRPARLQLRVLPGAGRQAGSEPRHET
jgi:hypothetical protein